MENVVEESWHQGELAIQKRVGTDLLMAEIGPKFIRPYMPLQHRAFFQSLSMLFIAYSDADGKTCNGADEHASNDIDAIAEDNIYASVIFGEPGFIHSPTDTELVINIQYSLGDFYNDSVNVGDKIGLIGIEFNSKRRNRINGVITDINQKTIQVSVLQSYGNCPKYIQPKTLLSNPSYEPFSLSSCLMSPTESGVPLMGLAREMVANADTFFIASRFNDGKTLSNRGSDMSHRGGEAGFVTINDDGQLLVPDYVGNGFFNTLGNLVENPTASLLFMDWQKGHALQITVSSEILWHSLNERFDNKSDVNFDNNLNDDLTNALNSGLSKKSEEENIKKERTLRFTPLKITLFKNGLAYRQTSTPEDA